MADTSYLAAAPPPGPAVQISPLSHLFGPIAVGSTSAAVPFTVTNNGVSPVALSPSTAALYSLAGGTCGATLAVATSCTYLVTFSPTAPGPTSGFLDVLIDGGPTLLHINLNGDGTVPGTAASVSPSPAFFPTTLVGSTSSPLTFTFTNFGINTLVWSGGSPGTSTEFTVTGGTCLAAPSVPAGGTCTVTAVFNPTSPGAKNASFTPAYNGPPVPMTMNGVGYVIQPGAGSQGGGYALVGGPNAEANRDRFEWAVRVRADGSLYGKSMTYRFTEAGTRYVARVAISSISTGSFAVTGPHASFDGAATLASVVGSTETPVPGTWSMHVESDDLIAGSNNGGGFDRVFIQIGSGSGLFHQTGSPGSPAVIAWGAVGNGYPWVA